MIIQPLQNYLLLEEIKQEVKAGIILTDDANIEKPNLAKVLFLGPEVSAMSLVGSNVLFKRHLFEEVTFGEKKYLIGQEDGVVAVIIDDAPEKESEEE